MDYANWDLGFERALMEHLTAFNAAWRPDMKATSPAGQAVEALDPQRDNFQIGEWLYLYGPSGSGKTIAALASAWRARDAAFDEERYTPDADGAAFSVAERFRLLTAATLSTAVAEARTGEARENLLQGLADADVVLVDSLGTVPMTEACLAFLAELIDRKSLGRVVMTAPLDPDGLLRRLRSTPAAAGLVRRITDRFTGIAFA